MAITPAARAAGDGDFDEREHWAFSTALEIGVLGHTGRGNITGTQITGPRVVNPPPLTFDLTTELVTPDRSREEILAALVGGTFEVMSPEIFHHGPRFFVDVNVSAPLGTEVGLAREGDPDELRLPDAFSASLAVGESGIEGRGNKITVIHQGPQIHAGFGAAFTIDLGTARIRLKPSVVYSRLKQDVYGVLHRAARLQPPGIGGPTDCQGPVRVFDSCYRRIQLSEKVEEVYHGIGPALEIEYDTGERLGPLDITLYLKGHASRLFGDVTTEMTQRNPDPLAVDPGERVFFKYSQDRWVFRAASGIRFRWVPRSMR